MNSDFFVSKCHQKFSSNYNKEEMTQKYLRENFWEVYNFNNRYMTYRSTLFNSVFLNYEIKEIRSVKNYQV